MCEHGARRYRCKDCSGSSMCEHGRERYYCVDCGGKGICQHGKRRSRCKDCGGGSTSAKAGGKAKGKAPSGKAKAGGKAKVGGAVAKVCGVRFKVRGLVRVPTW